MLSNASCYVNMQQVYAQAHNLTFLSLAIFFNLGR